MSNIRWLFVDVGNTLVNEERAVKDRIQQMVMAFAERGMHISEATVERAFEEASAEFAPSLMAGVVEKLAEHPEDRAFVLGRVKYRHELEEPYSDASEVLAILRQGYKIGVIANQSAGTSARLERYGLSPFLISLLFLYGDRPPEAGSCDLLVSAGAGTVRSSPSCDDW